MEQRGIFSCLSAALAPEIIYYLSDIIVFGISLHKYSYSHHSDRTNYRQCYNRILQRWLSRLWLASISLHDLQLCHRKQHIDKIVKVLTEFKFKQPEDFREAASISLAVVRFFGTKQTQVTQPLCFNSGVLWYLEPTNIIRLKFLFGK